MAQNLQSPAQLRAMFGANLRQLSGSYPSISDLSRQLGINRTQFNRYLAGESFPRPDVLARICSFFDVDARVLLEPVDQIASKDDPISNPFLRDFIGPGARNVVPENFPNGFYRFSRRSFVNHDIYVVGLIHIRRDGVNTFLRGFETREAMRLQDLPTRAAEREFRGLVMQQEDGIAIIAARANSMTCSFNYLSRAASFNNTFWAGYATRTVPEAAGNVRVTRMVYEHLGTSVAQALGAARRCGYCKDDELPDYHRRLLQPEKEFS